MMTSSLAKPARFGMRTCRSGLPPATHAAVACDIAAAHPGAHHAPLGAGQLGQALADRVHQLVDLHVLLVGRDLGRAHFGQLHRAADDRQRAAAVDQRADANRLVDVGRCIGRRRREGICAAAAAVRADSSPPAPKRLVRRNSWRRSRRQRPERGRAATFDIRPSIRCSEPSPCVVPAGIAASTSGAARPRRATSPSPGSPSWRQPAT